MRRSNDRSFLPIARAACLLPSLLPGNPRNERNCISEASTHQSFRWLASGSAAHFLPLSSSRKAERLSETLFDFRKTSGQKRKRAGPSHKPHPKATCPHPTRPLRPPGRRARDDYAQVTFGMQPKVRVFLAVFLE